MALPNILHLIFNFSDINYLGHWLELKHSNLYFPDQEDFLINVKRGELSRDEFDKVIETGTILLIVTTDYGRRVRKLPSLHGQKLTPTPEFLGMAEA